MGTSDHKGSVIVTEEQMRALLRDQRKDLIVDMDRANQPIEKRLDSIDDRLKELNGTVARHAIKHAQTEMQVEAVRLQVAEIMDERRQSTRRAADRALEEGENRKITRWDVRLVIAGATGGAALVVTLWKLLPAMLKALQP